MSATNLGVSVGKDGFEQSKTFLESMVRELEFPQIRVGIIRFNIISAS